jgi:hypothetical protein
MSQAGLNSLKTISLTFLIIKDKLQNEVFLLLWVPIPGWYEFKTLKISISLYVQKFILCPTLINTNLELL